MRWDFHNDAPIYTQLVDQITRMIVSGSLPPGERLPSVRNFAMEAGVNPNTMQRALTELERNGLIYSQRTSGHFVTDQSDYLEAAKTRLAAEAANQYLRDVTALGFSREEAEKLLQSVIRNVEECKNGDSNL